MHESCLVYINNLHDIILNELYEVIHVFYLCELFRGNQKVEKNIHVNKRVLFCNLSLLCGLHRVVFQQVLYEQLPFLYFSILRDLVSLFKKWFINFYWFLFLTLLFCSSNHWRVCYRIHQLGFTIAIDISSCYSVILIKIKGLNSKGRLEVRYPGCWLCLSRLRSPNSWSNLGKAELPL